MSRYGSCICGKSFRSFSAETKHRHNFPIFCNKDKLRRETVAATVVCGQSRQGDEYACRCGLRWPVDEARPACPRDRSQKPA